MTDHPSRAPRDGAPAPAAARTFSRCRADSRCGICRLLDEHGSKEHTIFRTMMSEEGDFLASLTRLAGLFYDSAPLG